MAAGDLITAPGQVEWDAALIDVTGPVDGAWMSAETGRDGWSPTWSSHDAQTSTGGVPGISVPQPMHPQLLGVLVDDPDWLVWWEMAMTPTHVTRTLAWWDLERDELRTAPAVPRRGQVRTADGSQLMPHRVIDLEWRIKAGSAITSTDPGS